YFKHKKISYSVLFYWIKDLEFILICLKKRLQLFPVLDKVQAKFYLNSLRLLKRKLPMMPQLYRQEKSKYLNLWKKVLQHMKQQVHYIYVNILFVIMSPLSCNNYEHKTEQKLSLKLSVLSLFNAIIMQVLHMIGVFILSFILMFWLFHLFIHFRQRLLFSHHLKNL